MRIRGPGATISTVAYAVLVTNSAANAQAIARCSPSEDRSVKSVSIVGRLGNEGTLVDVDTLWVPSEGRLEDKIYVRVVLNGLGSPHIDSVFVAATIQLMLRSVGGETAPLVAFPTRWVKDTIVADRSPSILVGPFSTNDLIPWPGISVNATPNALPVAASATAWVMLVYRDRKLRCSERLTDNTGRSRLVRLEFAH